MLLEIVHINFYLYNLTHFINTHHYFGINLYINIELDKKDPNEVYDEIKKAI